MESWLIIFHRLPPQIVQPRMKLHMTHALILSIMAVYLLAGGLYELIYVMHVKIIYGDLYIYL
jgi:hypothetical protein